MRNGGGEVPAPVVRELLRSLVLLLAPFAPYLAPSCGRSWASKAPSCALLARQRPELAREDELEIPVQIKRQAGYGRSRRRRCRSQGH